MESFLAGQSGGLDFVSLMRAEVQDSLDGRYTFHYLSNAGSLRSVDFNPVNFLPPIDDFIPSSFPNDFSFYNTLQGLRTGLGSAL